MANVIVEKQDLVNAADAIGEKLGTRPFRKLYAYSN